MGRFILLLCILAFLLTVMGGQAGLGPMGFGLLFLVPCVIMALFIKDYVED